MKKKVAIPMNASASVKAIPMYMRHLELSSELGLTRNALDGLADDDADADAGADGCEAITDSSDVSTDFGES